MKVKEINTKIDDDTFAQIRIMVYQYGMKTTMDNVIKKILEGQVQKETNDKNDKMVKIDLIFKHEREGRSRQVLRQAIDNFLYEILN